MPTCLLAPRRIYDYEFLYVKSGTAATTMYGDYHLLEAGKMVCIPAGVRHRNEIVSQPEAQLIGLHFDFFDELEIKTDEDMIVNEASVQADRFAVEAVAEGHAPLFEQAVVTPPPGFVQLMETIVDEFNRRSPGYLLMCKALMLQLLALLLRAQAVPSASPAVSQHARAILSLMQRIETDPGDDWTNARLAGELNVSPDHMIKLFRKVAGQPPGAFLQAVRHREARRLLRETNGSIEQVGRAVGYDDIHYFSRVFRLSEGISPKQYRRLMQNY